nr:fumarylacetoacetate hydrolase family protein [Sphingomonas sp. CDS-1]
MSNMDQAAIDTAAKRLRDATTSGIACAPVRELISGVDAAYAVQEANTCHWLSEGRRLVGRKTGLTSRAVQKQLGVDQPDYGMLFADMEVLEGQPVPLGRLLQPKVEAEVALIMGRDVDHADLTLAEFLRAVEFALPAIEIVDSRVKGWDIRIEDTIADNASSGCYVLGAEPRKLEGLDLRLCGMVMERAGEPVSVGAGAACLGHPVSSGVWLAGIMARAGRPLRAGDVVLTGALGPMVGVAPGDVIEARINGLGSVRAIFEAKSE